MAKALTPVILAFALVGCDNATEAGFRQDIALLREENTILRARLDGLEGRISEIDNGVRGVRALGIENAENADRLRKVVNSNADLHNKEKVEEMTARGACGTELVQLENGIWQNRRIPCTLKDLRPSN